MPNLVISSFSVSDVYENQAFILNFTILNNGIWTAEGIVVIVRCEGLDLTLYDNTLNPFNLSVDESLTILSDCSEISKKGYYVLSLIIDPDNLINEYYSNKNGTLREDWDNDNSLQIQMRIKAESGLGTSYFDIELLLWILIPIILGIVITIGSFSIKKRREKGKILKERQWKAREDLDEFEQKIRIFIRKQLKDCYKEAWWEKGIPQYIKDAIEPRLKEKLMKDPELSLDGIDLLNFDHYFPIISEKHNWDNTFSNIFSLVKNIEEPFENLQIFKNKLSQKQANMRDFAKYAMYIYAIEKYFMKEINIFLSYSTLDSEHFKISEIAKNLEKYPEINKLLFWEADSGEDIVDYMERTLQLSKTFILFCSENSMKSQAVEDEWKAAFQLRKKGLMKIIPVYEDERFIPALLTPLLNVKFDKDNFDEFVKNLYKEILRS